MKKDLLEKVDKIDLQVLEVNQNLTERVNPRDHQEMARKKVLVLKENQVLEINHQEMERKKVLVLKENQVFQKKMTENHLALQTIQNILAENHQKIHLQIQRKEKMVLRERKNLRVEIADQKTLVLKNTVKKELNLKIF